MMREIPSWSYSIVYFILVQKVLGWQGAGCQTKLFIILPKTSSCLYHQLRISCLQPPNDNVVEDASNP
jgi:hypothetical protein